MITYLGLPLYDLYSSSEDEVMTTISLVDEPAVESDFMCFKKDFKFTVNELEHKITGCAIWAEKPIYRIIDNTECYVRFSKQYIEELVEKYSRDGYWNQVNLQHDENNYVDGVTMVGFFIKDTAKGIDPKGFEEITDGSLFVTFKVTDDKLWDEIYNGDKLNGFSIEVTSSLKPAVEEVEDEFDWLEDLYNSCFVSERDVRSYIDDRKQLEITTDGKTFKGQIYSVGKDGGIRSAIIQNNDTMSWKVIPLDNIEKIKQTDLEIAAWQTEQPEFKNIIENDDITVEKTISAPVDTIDYAIDNNAVCMIRYYDGENSDGRGYRQGVIGAYGYTRKGNECIRFYQMYGSSHSEPSGAGIWRLLLTKRITDFHIVENMEPVIEAPMGFNPTGDDGMDTVIKIAEFI